MILVTGASGNLGQAVIDHLLKLVDPAEIAACMREAANSVALTSRGVEVRLADYDDPRSLVEPFREVDRLLLISASGIDDEKRAQQHRHAIDAAIEARVGQIYYTSLVPADGSVAYVMKAHLKTEAYLKSSGAAYTILKNGAYIEAWPRYLGDISSGEVVVPDDGPVAWVSRDDLAEATARLLSQSGHMFQTLLLMGPQVLDLAAVAEELSRVKRKQIKLQIVPVEEYVKQQVAAGNTEEFARHWATTYSALARGDFARTSSFLENLIERPPRKFTDVLKSQPST